MHRRQLRGVLHAGESDDLDAVFFCFVGEVHDAGRLPRNAAEENDVTLADMGLPESIGGQPLKAAVLRQIGAAARLIVCGVVFQLQGVAEGLVECRPAAALQQIILHIMADVAQIDIAAGRNGVGHELSGCDDVFRLCFAYLGEQLIDPCAVIVQ